jgi:hypothetical protein
MKRKLTGGLTSVMLPVFIQDSSSTIGAGLSGVTHASSGLVIEYRRAGESTWTTVTPVTKTLGTYVSGGIVADGDLAGAYEVDLPDAAFAAGVRFVIARIRGVANMLPCLIEIEIDAFAYQTATQPVNVTQVSGDATAADTLELFAESLDQATGQLDSGSLAAGTLTEAAFAANFGDTGLTLPKAVEMLAAFVAGRVSRSSAGGVTTLTYRKRDGTTVSFTAVANEDDGDRDTTGSLS